MSNLNISQAILSTILCEYFKKLKVLTWVNYEIMVLTTLLVSEHCCI